MIDAPSSQAHHHRASCVSSLACSGSAYPQKSALLLTAVSTAHSCSGPISLSAIAETKPIGRFLGCVRPSPLWRLGLYPHIARDRSKVTRLGHYNRPRIVGRHHPPSVVSFHVCGSDCERLENIHCDPKTEIPCMITENKKSFTSA